MVSFLEFSKFASLLHPIIGEGSSTHQFARTLFDAIITEENSDILESYSSNTFKAYFNGKTSIIKISQKILAFIEPEQFKSYLENFSDATTENLCTAFNDALPDIDLHNASEKITALFVSIIMESASTKKKGYSPKEEQRKNEFNEILKKKLMESGATVAETWTSLVANLVVEEEKSKIVNEAERSEEKKPYKLIPIRLSNLNENDKGLLQQFRTDVKELMKYIIDTDPAAEATRITLADEINDVLHKWNFTLREIEDGDFRKLVIEIIKNLSEYVTYISDKYLRFIPERNVLWFRNESLEEGDRLRNELQPGSYALRLDLAMMYEYLYPIPEDENLGDTEHVEADVVDGDTLSGAAENKTTIIQQQTNVVQNGENNFNLTNNGTMNFNL